MNEYITAFELCVMAGSLVGVYLRLNSDIVKLKSRVHTLENQHDEVKQTLGELVNLVTEIKLMLARRGLDGTP